MSITTWVEPAAIFFDSTEAISLPFAVEVERALDPDQNVVGRAQADRAAPHDAAAFALDHAPDRRGIEIDRRQRLHGVGGAGRRGDRARRRLRHHEAERGDDRDDDRRGAVAGQAADAVLVDHGAGGPLQAIAGLDHRTGERQHLLVVRAAREAQAVRNDDRWMSEYLPSTISPMMAWNGWFA